MYKFKESIFETKITEITISGKLFVLFKEWLQDTKLSKQKLKILKCLSEDAGVPLKKLNAKTKMSYPLINYHIKGNLRNVGLLEAELIITKVVRGVVYVSLSKFGKIVLDALRK